MVDTTVQEKNITFPTDAKLYKVVGISSFTGNPHDSKTLSATLDQVKQWTDRSYERVLVDRGYRGHGP
jgi:IS5 family transposase